MSEYILTAPREQQERSGRVRCHPSGRYVNPLAVRAADIDIRDIAHHLSHICRYTGASPVHYSVAQHCWLVSELLEQRHPHDYDLQLAGLLHDAAEYLFNDLASPVKSAPQMAWYRELERETARLILRTFGLDDSLLARVKPADDLIFQREVMTWWGGSNAVQPWQPSTAETQYLARFDKLQAIRLQRSLI
jgi:5'-deoxynucleotidase YfbR-like HD superfamily hydrolase